MSTCFTRLMDTFGHWIQRTTRANIVICIKDITTHMYTIPYHTRVNKENRSIKKRHHYVPTFDASSAGGVGGAISSSTDSSISLGLVISTLRRLLDFRGRVSCDNDVVTFFDNEIEDKYNISKICIPTFSKFVSVLSFDSLLVSFVPFKPMDAISGPAKVYNILL
ncbi:hypothetical protein V1477_019004 [Vespula maculifrons]|uniref:Uncharacterized protein n=1 Tax=Vespula maculifrons TaxID=7453 RepID=A0ABD2ATV1_VESMC